MEENEIKQDEKNANIDENNEKHEHKHGFVKELKEKLHKTAEELELANKTIEEQKSTINNYLSTASYYKNELENQKKDFDRYRERNKGIQVEANKQANESVAKKLLPIIDSFDQAISHVDAEVMKGFAMIYGSLVSVLTELGVVEIKAVGEPLNGEFHNCIATEPTDDDSKDGTVANVYQKGYKFEGTNNVVRPATVSVYKKNL